MKDDLKLSIIMPVYQGENFIEKSVTSLLNQDYHNVEIILIDDGSRDRSGELCDGFKENDPRIQVIHQVNQGPSAARNSGLDIATGDYITFVDADDRVAKEAFNVIMRALAEASSDIVIFGSVFDYYKKGVLKASQFRHVDEKMSLQGQGLANAFIELLHTECLTAIWNKVIKASLIKDNNIHFNETMRIYEDFEFFLQVCRHVEMACILPDTFYHYAIEVNQSLILKRTLDENTYIENMNLLKSTMDNYLTLYPVSYGDLKELNELIFRGYIYEIERAFLCKRSIGDRMKVINEFFTQKSIQACIQNSSPTKFRMSMIHRGFLKRNKPLIYLVFLMKTFETRLRYNH